MGLLQSIKRAFSRSCPNCKTNDADLPPEKRISREVVDEAYHLEGHNLSTWKIRVTQYVKYKCKSCGHKWKQLERH